MDSIRPRRLCCNIRENLAVVSPRDLWRRTNGQGIKRVSTRIVSQYAKGLEISGRRRKSEIKKSKGREVDQVGCTRFSNLDWERGKERNCKVRQQGWHPSCCHPLLMATFCTQSKGLADPSRLRESAAVLSWPPCRRLKKWCRSDLLDAIYRS